MPTLILSPRFTDDSQALWRAAIRLGWNVERLPNWRVSSELLNVHEPVFYLEGLMAPSLATQFGQQLIEPSTDWLPTLPVEYSKRNVFLTTLGQARQVNQPRFVKPPNEKSFPASVYVGEDLPKDFDDEMLVLVAEVVEWDLEFRCFLLHRELKTFSIYARKGEFQKENRFAASDSEQEEVTSYVEKIAADLRVTLPPAIVLDVGTISGRGWAVVELNAAWGSGIYGCEPTEVLEVLRHATGRIESHPPQD